MIPTVTKSRNTAAGSFDVLILKGQLRKKWPESISSGKCLARDVFKTGIEAIDELFPHHGIPRGQIVEIKGRCGCGKTSLMHRITSKLSERERVAWVDSNRAFFPASAVEAGVNISKLLLVTPENAVEGLRTVDLLLSRHLVKSVVIDLIGQKGELPDTIIHRIRQRLNQSGGTLFFVTEDAGSQSVIQIPTSTVSLRLIITRRDLFSVLVTVNRSRVSREGMQAEVPLYG